MYSRIITFTNQKGGVGKTTTCQNTGVVLSKMGYKVLCVDVDSQAHLTVSFGITNPETLEYSLVTLINEAIKRLPITKDKVLDCIIHTSTVDILPCTYNLQDCQIGLDSITDREYVLYDILHMIYHDYDYILVDCNSSRNIFTINALGCADEIIIPCQAQFLSAGGIELALSMVSQLKRRVNPKLEVGGILITMFQKITHQSNKTLKILKENYNEKVYKTIIPYSTKVADAQENGKSIIEYMCSNPVSKSYINFVEKEIV